MNYSALEKEHGLDEGELKHEPWVVVDPFFKREWLLPQAVRYYVVEDKSTGKWFVCERWTDTAVSGTEANSRAEAIRQFYALCDRPIPNGYTIPRAMPGVAHHGETG